MASALAEAHIAAEARLRATLVRAIEGIWKSLPGYDRENLDEWLTRALPVVDASQRQSALLTDAYLARALDRRPVGLDLAAVIGAGARGGVSPEVVYERPFVTVWGDLAAGKLWEDATAAGLARATGTAAMDVQLSMARTAQTIGSRDSQIQRFRRVADADACQFCQTVDGAILLSDQAMALHNFCGCGIEPETEPLAVTPTPQGVAIHEHGELGPMLGDPAHDFTVL